MYSGTEATLNGSFFALFENYSSMLYRSPGSRTEITFLINPVFCFSQPNLNFVGTKRAPHAPDRTPIY
jgi:hypothetical protein